MPENEQSQQIVPKAPFPHRSLPQGRGAIAREKLPAFPRRCWRRAEDRRGEARRGGSWDEGGGRQRGGGGRPSMPNTTPGLTWRSDAHVLLAVHHEASHRLPVGVVGCALTYWKSAEGCFFFFLTTPKRVHVASRPRVLLAPCLRTPRMTASGDSEQRKKPSTVWIRRLH